MASSDNEVRMMMSVYPGAMTGFAAMNAGLSSILNVFNGMTRAFDQQFGLVDAALTTTSVVVTQLGVDAMNAFGQFEQGMKIVQMVSGQTASDMDYLKQKANEFSVEYRTDIDQITEGLQTLGRAGLNTASEQAQVLENGLTTAKLEGRELNGVLQELIQNTALLGGDLKSNEFGEDSQYVNDLLVATSMTAPITTHDISETLKYSGGIAAAAGAKIRTDTGEMNEQGKAILEDYMGTIAAFAQKGVTGSIAGTALRAFLNKPATQDSSVTDALASIHLKPEYLWEDGEEVMKPISQQIAIIQNQMDELNVSTMDRLQIWSKIVGGKMGQQMMKLDSEDIKEITKDIQAADDAENLAANSMKTYEANVKAAKESVAGLQRNVGEKLVLLANPWLEMMNKVLEFLNNDITGSVLAGSVIAFVGFLFTQIRKVASTIRGEISSLLSLTKDARAYIHQSMTGRAQLDKETVGSFVAMQREKEKKSRKSWSEKAASDAGADSAKGFKEYWNQYSAGVKESSPLSFTKLKEAGVVGDRLAAISRLQDLRSIDEIGIKDQDYVAAGMRYGYLSKDQEARLVSGAQQGMTSRQLFNYAFGDRTSVEFEALKQKLLADTEASKALGFALDNEARARRAFLQTFGTGATKVSEDFYKNQVSKFNNQMNETMMKTFGPNANTPFASKGGIGIAQDTYANQIAKAIDQGAIKSAEVVNFGGEQVVAEFNEMMATLNQSVAAKPTTKVNPNAMTPLNFGVLPPYTEVPSHLLNVPFTQVPVNDPTRNYRIGAADDQYRAAMAAHFDRLYNQVSPVVKELSNVEKRINKALTEKNIQKANKDPKVDGARAEYYNRKALEQRVPGVGYMPGSYQGKLPTQDAIDASLNAAKQQEIKTTQQSAATKQNEIEKLDQEIVTLQKEIDSAYANAEAAIKDEAAFQANALAVEKMTASAEIFVRVMENTWQEALQLGLTQDQKSKLKAMNHAADQRGLKISRDIQTKKDRTKFQQQDSKLITSRNEISKIQSESRKQYQELQEIRRHISNPQNFGKYSAQYDALRKPYIGEEIAKQNQDVIKRVQQNPVIMQNYHGNMGIAGGLTESEKLTKIQGFWASVGNRWNADRVGRLNFGEIKGADGVLRSTTKGLRGLGNGLLNMTDLIGGPVMIAFMLIPELINLWKGAFEDFCNDLKEAGDNVKEAYSKRNAAEDALEQTYREGNPDATEEEINDMVLNDYGALYDDLANNQKEYLKKASQAAATPPEYEYDTEKDDGSLKVKEEEIDAQEKYNESIKENTAALYAATAQLYSALNVYGAKMTDPWWGLDGWTGQVTDAVTNIGNNETFNSNNGNFLLTASQKDENYSGYTEMAGLMLEDMKDANGNWIKGMRTMMGDDVDFYSHIIGTHTPADNFLRSAGKFAASDLSPVQNARLQASMKNDSKTWKSLAKELAKYESKQKKTYNPEKGVNRIQNLIKKLQSTLGSGFNDTKVLQAAYLQIAQDMFTVAQTVFIPLVQQNATSAAQTVAGVGQVFTTTNGTGGNTYNTAAIAASIAAMLGTIALAQSGDAARAQAMLGGDLDGDHHVSAEEENIHKLALETNSGDEFMREALKRSEKNSLLSDTAHNLMHIPSPGNITQMAGLALEGASRNFTDRSAADYIAKIYGVTTYMTTKGMDSQTATDAINSYMKEKIAEGATPQDILKTLGKNWVSDGFVKQVEDSYLNSLNEEDGSGSGGGSGGSGSGDKDKDTGTKKERVDLVLCNKKEIPKLNVNLFKKAPSFTILNKNFKLRDIKVNTQDKPKAVLASIKNAIIDVQKRTDPKIIQDEQAEYDPVAATDGNQTPSGSTGTTTDE